MSEIKVGDKFTLEIVAIIGDDYVINSKDDENYAAVSKEFLELIPKCDCDCDNSDDSCDGHTEASIFGAAIGVVISMTDEERKKYFFTSELMDIVLMDPQIVIGGIHAYIKGEHDQHNDKEFSVGDVVTYIDESSGHKEKRLIVCEINGDMVSGLCDNPDFKDEILVTKKASECTIVKDLHVDRIGELVELYELTKKVFSITE